MREQHVAGVQYLETVTALLQRARKAHPTKGLFEAADLQWWWRTPRSTDSIGQLFWFDDHGRPEAAVIATAWSSHTSLCPIVMPDATPDWVAHVVDRGLAHARESGSGTIELEADRDDDILREVLVSRGFTIEEEDAMVESWIAADARPEVSVLHEEYRLASRSETMPSPHHMISRNGPDVAYRLVQTSLYRPGLDLVILDREGHPAAYGLFWHDPETATGLVEPMRTEVAHQRRGLARHVLTAGIDLLANAGAERIKICFEPSNPASSALYLSVGFVPVKQTVVFTGHTGNRT